MDSRRFKRKKFMPSQVDATFPELLNDEPYIGIYNGHNVSVVEKHAIHDIYNEGNYGKGSLSKSGPTREVVHDVPEILMRQQWENRLKWDMQLDSKKIEENRIYIESIQKLLDSTYEKCDGNSWKKWKQNMLTENEYNKTENKDRDNSPSISNETLNDLLSEMVEEILLTKKVKHEELSYHENSKMALVVEDIGDQSVTEEEFKLSNIKVKLRKCLQTVNETLKLNLVEAFFLCFAVQRMKIINEDGVILSFGDLWSHFMHVDKNFISKYVAYHHYRSHGWTVKSGIKFGGDYLLYKIGPAYYHASYLVWLLDKRKTNKLSWNEFVALNRLVETCNKDLLLCEILDSNVSDKDLMSPSALRKFSVLEVVCKRWIPSQERG